MFNFIRYFIMEWENYPGFLRFINARFTPAQIKSFEEQDRKRGIEPYRGRFDYAWRNTKIHFANRSLRRCKKYKGDCKECTARQC